MKTKHASWLWAALFGVAALLLAQQALAQEGDAAMRGKDIIYEIFGVDATSLMSALSSARDSASILASVSSVVGMVAMFAALVIMILTFLHAMLAQGETGRVMGKFSSFWVPLRFVMAMGMLVPVTITAGGYSVVSVVVLWLGLTGSDYADMAWTKANDYMGQNFALTTPATAPDTKAVVAGLYSMEVCAAALRRSAANGGNEYGVDLRGDGGTYRSEQVPGWLGTEIGQRTELVHSLSYDGAGALMASGGLCGQMELRRSGGEGTPAGDTMQRQIANIASLRAGLQQLAEAHVSGQLTGGEVRAALVSEERAFTRNEQLRERMFAAHIPSIANAQRQQQMQRAETQGWTAAGSYYMTMVGISTGLNAQLSASPRFTPQRVEQLSPMVAEDVTPWLAQAHTAVMGSQPVSRVDAPPATQGGGWMGSVMGALGYTPAAALFQLSTGGAEAAYEELLAKIRDAVLSVVSSAPRYVLTSVQDPVVTLASIGNRLLETLHVLLGALIVAAVAVGATTGGAGALVLLTFGVPLLAALFIPAVFLAFFLPGIPYFMWIMGVAGWMLMLVQAATAGPLWAAAHAMPDGDGFAGTHARQGYMLLISLVARPLLMVIGLIAAMLVVRVAVRFVATTFGYFMESASTGSAAGGVIGGVALLVIFAGVILVIVRWSFSLIHLVPDTVLRFIGGVSESLGEASVADQVKVAALALYGYGRTLGSGVTGAVSGAKKLHELGAAKAAKSVRAGQG